MELKFKRLPRHIGVIPDGNRRWAIRNGLPKEAGYGHGVEPGFKLYHLCLELGIEELSFYGFTTDNTKRPSVQRRAFQQACIDSVKSISSRDAALLVLGNTDSPMFPEELKPYTNRVKFGKGSIKVNFLVNYSWSWDLAHAFSNKSAHNFRKSGFSFDYLASSDISRIDLIIRWGGRRRLSGFLPAQSVYSDIFIIDALWPDFQPEQFFEALRWYESQDVTLGG